MMQVAISVEASSGLVDMTIVHVKHVDAWGTSTLAFIKYMHSSKNIRLRRWSRRLHRRWLKILVTDIFLIIYRWNYDSNVGQKWRWLYTPSGCLPTYPYYTFLIYICGKWVDKPAVIRIRAHQKLLNHFIYKNDILFGSAFLEQRFQNTRYWLCQDLTG